MSSKEWLEEYSKVEKMVKELNSKCCMNDNHTSCTMCKYRKKCMIISAVRGVMSIK